MNRRVIVGMSGGVDSSVSAALLQEAGHAVEGLYMFNWAEDEQGYCTAAEDYQDAARVCNNLSIPLHTADFSREYRELVFEYFLSEYAAGRTPNPDVLCNREIKFGRFLEHAGRLGADRIATGHYAALEHTPAATKLIRARDATKDQTYFLCAVSETALRKTLFPLGNLLKPEVRTIAAQRGFPNHAKRDSTGICFIGERRFQKFLAGYLPSQPGPIRTRMGDGRSNTVGEHRGLMYYTLGQRRALGIGGRHDSEERPWYVVEKDLPNNTLWVSQDAGHPNLRPRILLIEPAHWIGCAPDLPLRCTGRIRHRHADQACVVEARADGLMVTFDEPLPAPAPGQFVAFYDRDTCLGGAAIRAI